MYNYVTYQNSMNDKLRENIMSNGTRLDKNKVKY
jgi:hypothetical protein